MTDPILAEIFRRIEALGLSNRKVCARAKVWHGTLTRWKTGQTKMPGLATIRAIEAALDAYEAEQAQEGD